MIRSGLLTVLVLVLSCAAPGENHPRDRNPAAEKQEKAQKETPGKAEHPRADNSDCLVCHLDLEKEPLVAVHAGKNVGCTKCHGDSWDHADDEGHETPPEIMYPLEKIDPACKKCHPSHDVPARKVLARWMERNPRGSFKTRSAGPRPSETAEGKARERGDLDGVDRRLSATQHSAVVAGRSPDGVLKLPLKKKASRKIVCTECHGRHRLKTRTVRWNRKTGELIEE